MLIYGWGVGAHRHAWEHFASYISSQKCPWSDSTAYILPDSIKFNNRESYARESSLSFHPPIHPSNPRPPSSPILTFPFLTSPPYSRVTLNFHALFKYSTSKDTQERKQIEKHETLAMQDIGEYPQRSRKDLTENDEVREHQDNLL